MHYELTFHRERKACFKAGFQKLTLHVKQKKSISVTDLLRSRAHVAYVYRLVLFVVVVLPSISLPRGSRRLNRDFNPLRSFYLPRSRSSSSRARMQEALPRRRFSSFSRG